MKIIHLVPGSGGGFYCQNCVRDVAHVRALHQAGHDVLVVPMYLPSTAFAGDGVGRAPVFYGAVNVYLEQKLPFFRHLPQAVRRRFDAPRVLRWAASKAGTTRANGLGDLTLSVLNGREGRQRRELEQMLDWLAAEARPDLVHVSNALLLGLAPALREAFGARVVCTLQDEDVWLDALEPAFREACWNRVRALAADVDVFLPVSRTYARIMRERLGLPETRFRVLHPGVDVRAFQPASAPPAVPTLGFLSELAPARGLDVLVEAFLLLKRNPALKNLRLRVTGGELRSGSPYREGLRARLSAAGCGADAEFLDAYREPDRQAFLRSLSVLSVPSIEPEAFGLFQIEAMACGVPVVQPDVGAYPEVVAETGGGVVYADRTPAGLAAALFPLLADPALAVRYGQAGRRAVAARFDSARTAETLAALYGELIRGQEKTHGTA